MITKKENKIICIASGKGGTGKTCVAATLAYLLAEEGKKVLVVDCDLTVRGLSSLLYLQRENPKVTGKIPVAILLAAEREIEISELGVESYKGFFILPAVSSIEETIDFKLVSKFTTLPLRKRLRNYLHKLSINFDYILLDTPAGVNPISLTSALISDIVILVTEEDAVAMSTMENFERHLRKFIKKRKKRGVSTYTLINKARNIEGEKDLNLKYKDYKMRQFYSIGIIPFDIEVMNSFGKDDFWDQIRRTIFISGLYKVWNRLAELEEVDLLRKVPRLLPDFLMQKRLGKYSLIQRLFLLYGISLALLSIGLFVIPLLDKMTFIQRISVVAAIASIIFILIGLFSKGKLTLK